MRKYREYSDSELREKFPEVDDSKYPRAKCIQNIKAGIGVLDRRNGKLYTNIDDLDHAVSVSSLTKNGEE